MLLVRIICLAVIAISTSRQCECHKLVRATIIDRVSRLLFGDIWKFDQFCGYNLTGVQKAQDDLVFQGYFNGSALESLLELKQTEEIDRGLNQLVYTGLKARSSISIVCSISSWGYADERSFQLSNTARGNPTGCRTGLSRMMNSLKDSSPRRRSFSDSGNRFTPALEDLASPDIQSDTLLRDRLQLNTFGRINQGSPFDSHIWLGDYSACARLPQTRYCFGALRSDGWPSRADWTSGGDDFIRIAMCLPEDCTSRSFSSSDQLTRELDRILKLQIPGIAYHLQDVYCLPEDDSLIRNMFGDRMNLILIVLSAIWITVIIYATLFRRSCLENSPAEKQTSSRVFDSFDVKNNLSRFFSTRPDTEGMIGLNMIKVIGIMWLVCSHNLQLLMPYLRNPQDMWASANTSPLAAIILQAQHGVVAFFLISGFLVGYKYLGSNRDICFSKMVVARYARLAPLYLLGYIVVKRFAHLMGSGPLWDYGVSPESEIRQCMQESWLVPLLMLADFIPPFSHCILTGWHIANDFHIFLLIPLLLKVYQKSRKAGRLISITSFAISHLFHWSNFHLADNFNYETLAHEPFTIGSRTLMERLANDYVNPIGRFGTYFLGILLADIIIERRSKNVPPTQVGAQRQQLSISMFRSINAACSDNLKLMNKWGSQDSGVGPTRCDCYRDEIYLMLAFVSQFICLACPAGPSWLKNIFNPYSKSVTYPLVRLVNELSWFYLIYYILKRQKPLLKVINDEDGKPEKSIDCSTGSSSTFAALNWPFWNITVKLNYTLVVIHYTIARYLIQTQTQLPNFSWIALAQIIGFNLVATYMVTFVVHLLVEVPLMSIVTEILKLAQIDRTSKRDGDDRQKIKDNIKFVKDGVRQ